MRRPGTLHVLPVSSQLPLLLQLDMDINLTCRVCLGEFDNNAHRPLLLPACGHTFCTSCIGHLYKQSNLGCPECKKANAIKAISSLPVNYSLLSVVQSKQRSASTSETMNSPPDVKPKSFVSPESCHVPHKTLQKSQNINSPHPLNSVPQVTSSLKNVYRGSSRRENSNSHHSTSQRSHQFAEESSRAASFSPEMINKDPETMTLQDELDFQMAVHLTFCKDASHGHDDPTRSFHCWQYPEDEELHTALALSRGYLGQTTYEQPTRQHSNFS